MGENWSDTEVEMIVADYFSMLVEELKGNFYNKSEHRRNLKPFLNDRPDLSIERKHQNISAINIELGIPYIKGYKPLNRAQRSKLIPTIQKYIASHPQIVGIFERFSNSAKILFNPILKFEDLLVAAPDKRENILMEPTPSFKSVGKVNYLEKEQQNALLGKKGEELAIAFEKNLLIKAGKEALAERVEWLSENLGDGLGFDILSRNFNGTDKYIEVKTTKLGIYTPFFFTSNEYNFSRNNKDSFYLYRIFNFNSGPKMFQVQGSYDEFCNIESVQFKGFF